MKKYRTGIIGPVHLNSHLYALSAVPNIELVAAVAQTEAEKKPFQQYGVSKFYSNYEEMLNREDLDIFEIDSEPNRRYEMTLAAAEHGIHVIGEKPISVSLVEADEMVEATDRAGVQFVIQNMRRCDPYHIRAKKLLEEGFIGELLTIRAICRDPRPAGHCLINLGTHLFDITRRNELPALPGASNRAPRPPQPQCVPREPRSQCRHHSQGAMCEHSRRWEDVWMSIWMVTKTEALADGKTKLRVTPL